MRLIDADAMMTDLGKRLKLVTAYELDRIEVPKELATRILDTIEKYIAEKKEEFEKLGVDMRGGQEC